MSPHAVNDLASSFVQMAKAFEELPLVQAENSELQQELARKLATIQRLELKLMDRSNEITALHSQLRAEEAKRSDAETMFLESDDKTQTLIRVLDGLGKDILGALQAVMPQAIEPMKVPEVVQVPDWITDTDYAKGQSDLSPTASTSEPEGVAPTNLALETSTSVENEAVSSVSVDPTLVSTQEVEKSPSVTSPVITEEDASSKETHVSPFDATPIPPDTEPSSAVATGPYVGLKYKYYPGYVSHGDWIAGGGLDEDYWPTQVSTASHHS